MSPPASPNEDNLLTLTALPVGSWGASDLQSAREGLGLTQAELAAAVGYDRSAIAKVEGGDSPPRRVVELAVRYLIERRPRGTRFQVRFPDIPTFRPNGAPLGVNERTFPGEENVEVKLSPGPAVWFRVFPEFDTGKRWTSIELKKATTQGGFPLVQMISNYQNLSFVRAADGFGVYGLHLGRADTHSVSFVFETGEIWSVNTYMIDAIKRHAENSPQRGIPYFEDHFKLALHSFRTVLDRLGVRTPLRWIAGVEGIEGFGLYYPLYPGHFFANNAPLGLSLIDKVCETGMMDDTDTPATALKPFFTKLFSAFAVERPDYLDNLSNPRP